VLDPRPARRGVRTAAAGDRFERLAAGAVEAVAVMVEDAGHAGFALDALSSRAGIAPDEHAVTIAGLERAGVIAVAGTLFARRRIEALRGDVIDAVKQHHARHPLDEGLPREELRERLFSGAPAPLFEHVLGILKASGDVVVRDRVALRGHSLALTDEEARARDAIVQLLQQAALAPPDPSELAARIGVTRNIVDRIAGLLVRQKILVRVGDLTFHESALRRLKDDVRSMKTDDASAVIDVGTFKDRYHVTRKYAIPLLEFLDRERVTRRVGEGRRIL
jgi:selenocysteine-specific elongation factor